MRDAHRGTRRSVLHMNDSCQSSYLFSALDPKLRAIAIYTILRIIREWEQEGLTFDTIAFRGMSGALLSPRIADILEKRLLLSRKDKDCSHSSYKLEGCMPDRYIIIDDLTVSGQTIRNTISAITRKWPESICAGIVLYHSDEPDRDITLDNGKKIPSRSFYISRDTKKLQYYRGKKVESNI